MAKPLNAKERKERNARGEYFLVEPFDQKILSFLPDEGTLALGLYPLGETAQNLRKKFSPEQQKALTATQISARLISMQSQGLVVNKHTSLGAGGRLVWQRTKAGLGVLKAWEGANGGSTDKPTGPSGERG